MNHKEITPPPLYSIERNDIYTDESMSSSLYSEDSRCTHCLLCKETASHLFKVMPKYWKDAHLRIYSHIIFSKLSMQRNFRHPFFLGKVLY